MSSELSIVLANFTGGSVQTTKRGGMQRTAAGTRPQMTALCSKLRSLSFNENYGKNKDFWVGE